MKILLAYPYFLYDRAAAENIDPPPIGLYYLGAALIERGHEVVIANWHDRRDDAASIEAELKAAQPDLVGISMFHANRWGGIDVAALAKRAHPAVPVVAGGVGATFLDALLLAHFPDIDYVVRGEGEQTFAALADWLASDRRLPLDSIRGLSFRSEGRLLSTPDAPRIENLDELPDPARHYSFQHVALSRGCPGKCTFCGSPRFWGPKVRYHSAAYFVDQLERLVKKGVSFFYFSDDTFTLKKELVHEVCASILERGLDIQWAAISRVDSVDAATLALMRRAGCIQISFGIESGAAMVRAQLNKRFDDAAIERAFALATRHGILARAYLIYGNPGESDATIEETVALVRRIKPLVVLFHILTLFPGTELYDASAKRCGFGDEIWLERNEDIFYFQTDPELPQESVLAWGRRLKDAYYESLPGFVESIELHDDPAFAPLHADFLSRLGMTFQYGDYAAVAAIADKDSIAERCYRRALGFGQSARAALGLGVLLLKRRDFKAAADLLGPAVAHFPGDPQLSLYLGIGHMNLCNFAQAIDEFEKWPDSSAAQNALVRCREQERRLGVSIFAK